MSLYCCLVLCCSTLLVYPRSRFFSFQAEVGIRELVRSRGLGDVYKSQGNVNTASNANVERKTAAANDSNENTNVALTNANVCLLYTSDAADERSSVDLGGRRIIKKKDIVVTSRNK